MPPTRSGSGSWASPRQGLAATSTCLSAPSRPTHRSPRTTDTDSPSGRQTPGTRWTGSRCSSTTSPPTHLRGPGGRRLGGAVAAHAGDEGVLRHGVADALRWRQQGAGLRPNMAGAESLKQTFNVSPPPLSSRTSTSSPSASPSTHGAAGCRNFTPPTTTPRPSPTSSIHRPAPTRTRRTSCRCSTRTRPKTTS